MKYDLAGGPDYRRLGIESATMLANTLSGRIALKAGAAYDSRRELECLVVDFSGSGQVVKKAMIVTVDFYAHALGEVFAYPYWSFGPP